ncbi:hypothetical protein LWI29_004023 [Acer saccharum]|uniref:Malectin-like domain-containing protein n=1 Tax=Acer saccharum TaxID=4024 RepID=A0AA39VYT0_ACESA|nr:hypothetical protein LWI29_004023 [Acer saccharum]
MLESAVSGFEPRKSSSSLLEREEYRPAAPLVRRYSISAASVSPHSSDVSKQALATKVQRLKDKVKLAKEDYLELRQEVSDLQEYSNAKLDRVTRYLGVLAEKTRKLDQVALETEARISPLINEKKRLFNDLLTAKAVAIHVNFAANYVPSEQILSNCGESLILNDTDTQSWTPDVKSKFLLSAKSLTSKATTQDPLVPKVPFMTTRVSHSEFSYSFPVITGRKFMRLYFYSNSYNGFNATNAMFSVSSGSFSLLKNFSTAQTTDALNYAYIVKEYLIAMDDETLTIKFTPSTNSLNAYAFVNGIEVMSMPDDIYKNDDGTLKMVDQDSLIYIDNTTVLENVYRINVGGNDISPFGDTGLYRSWYNDQPYLYGETFGIPVTTDPSKTIITYPKDMPTYIAPEYVYSTVRLMGLNPQINKNYKLTLIFSVDVGFVYMVRLHLCEVQAAISEKC